MNEKGTMPHLEKAAYLDGISAYETLIDADAALDDKMEALKRIYQILKVYTEKIFDVREAVELAAAFECFTEDEPEKAYVLLIEKTKNLLDVLTDDYNFQVAPSVPYAWKTTVKNKPDVITVGMYPADTDADILLTEDDIFKALNEKYPFDMFVYNRLFIESKLKRLEEEKIRCIVTGLSYTQYGVLENKMPLPAVNLSVIGQDTPYSVLMAEHALRLNPEVEYVVIPMTYYHVCYDMSDDNMALHKDVVSKINIPILKDARNFKELTRVEWGGV